VKSDTRFQPKPEEVLDRLQPEIRTVCEGQGIVLFSGAQLHSTVPNTSGVTRYSIDFRTVNFQDVVNKVGAHNIDSEPQGTSLRDFMRGPALERIPPEVVALYEEAAPKDAVLTYIPS